MKTTINQAVKSRILAILIVILSPSVFFAQGKAEKVEQLKIAYFTKELNLTTQEAEKFWPVYNEMEKKIKALRKERRKTFKELEDKGDSLSVELVKKHTNSIFDSEIAEVNTKKEYYAKIGGIIGYKKATKVYKVERDFKRELLMRLKEERGQTPKPSRSNKPE
jgi:septal ring factor EnvC (AmiA/AmiB activator)